MKTSLNKVRKLAEVHHETMIQLVRDRYPHSPHLTQHWNQLSPGEREDRLNAMNATIEFAYQEKKDGN